MAVIFKHNDKVYQCMSLDKKLKKLRINKDEIDILFEGELTKDELESKFLEMTKEIKEIKESKDTEDTIKKYYFRNRVNNSTIVSIYPTLDDLKGIVNIDDYDLYER